MPILDDNDGRGRGRGRGRGGARGGGRGRQFDRHSGTGKTYVILRNTYAHRASV
jgi:hypothetical protein